MIDAFNLSFNVPPCSEASFLILINLLLAKNSFLFSPSGIGSSFSLSTLNGLINSTEFVRFVIAEESVILSNASDDLTLPVIASNTSPNVAYSLFISAVNLLDNASGSTNDVELNEDLIVPSSIPTQFFSTALGMNVAMFLIVPLSLLIASE